MNKRIFWLVSFLLAYLLSSGLSLASEQAADQAVEQSDGQIIKLLEGRVSYRIPAHFQDHTEEYAGLMKNNTSFFSDEQQLTNINSFIASTSELTASAALADIKQLLVQRFINNAILVEEQTKGDSYTIDRLDIAAFVPEHSQNMYSSTIAITLDDQLVMITVAQLGQPIEVSQALVAGVVDSLVIN